MKRLMPLAVTALIATAMPAQARSHAKHAQHEGMAVVIVGEVSSQPRDFGFAREKKMQVSAGPGATEYSLHLRGAQLADASGQKRGVSDLKDKMWVRAEGRLMSDPRRIKISRLEVIGNDRLAYEQSSYYRPDIAAGYLASVVSSVAGSRETLPAPAPEPYYGFRTQERDVDMQEIGPDGALYLEPNEIDISYAPQTVEPSPEEEVLCEDLMEDEMFYGAAPDLPADTMIDELFTDVPASEETVNTDTSASDEIVSDALEAPDLPTADGPVIDHSANDDVPDYTAQDDVANDISGYHPDEIANQPSDYSPADETANDQPVTDEPASDTLPEYGSIDQEPIYD